MGRRRTGRVRSSIRERRRIAYAILVCVVLITLMAIGEWGIRAGGYAKIRAAQMKSPCDFFALVQGRGPSE
jgi:hypothetical protein